MNNPCKLESAAAVWNAPVVCRECERATLPQCAIHAWTPIVKPNFFVFFTYIGDFLIPAYKKISRSDLGDAFPIKHSTFTFFAHQMTDGIVVDEIAC